MSLLEFIAENQWGLAVGAVAVAFSAGTVVVTVRLTLKQVANAITSLRVDMQAKDAAHDAVLREHDEKITENAKHIAVLESKFDSTIRNMGEQLNRIYNKLMGVS